MIKATIPPAKVRLITLCKVGGKGRNTLSQGKTNTPDWVKLMVKATILPAKVRLIPLGNVDGKGHNTPSHGKTNTLG